MNYYHKKNFLDSKTCKSLVKDYEELTSEINHRWQGGRKLIANTSLDFQYLRKDSESWNLLAEKIESNEFIEEILSELGINPKKFKYTKFYSTLSNITFLNKLREKSLGQVRNSNPLVLILWSFYSFSVRFFAFVYSKFTMFFGFKLAELFYDASSASNGYSREIHRDSDSRIFVFLIYLNSLKMSKLSSGGELCTHVYIGNDSQDPPPQPSLNDAPIDNSIAPEMGSLIFFENKRDAYHSVSKMEGYEGERFFIYGSLTIINGSYKHFCNSKYKLDTDIRIYL